MHTDSSILQTKLKDIFGFDHFKGDQEAIIQSLLDGNDTFVIMPTGGGKSLCYQLPAIMSEGTAIVVSPLIALMKNQVDAVRYNSGNDYVAHFLNSSLNKQQVTEVKDDLLKGGTKMLYVAPETLSRPDTIDFLNQDNEINGYIIQMPLPKQVSIDKVTAHVDPRKDMDCFHPANMGNLLLGKECYLPATPHGVMELIRRSHIETTGKECVILGRSNIVGKPLAMLLLQKDANATVTVCHSRTKNLKRVCSRADILIVAIGQPEMITEEYVKDKATVIDVGIHRIPDPGQPNGYRVCGDVKYDEVSKKCEAITPVPGGVGPMTMACLLLNTMKAYKGC